MNAEYLPPAPEPGFSATADSLIGDEQLSGDIILDRFIGTLMRHGGVETSSHALLQPHEIINTISTMAVLENSQNRPEGSEYTSSAAAKMLTRSYGLRSAAEKLSVDARVQDVVIQDIGRDSVNGPSRRFVTDPERRQPVLATVHQIEGYLYGDPAANETSQVASIKNEDWMNVLGRKVEDVASGITSWPLPRRAVSWDGGTTEVVERTEAQWRNVLNAARHTGVDMDLLQRSAEYIAKDRRRLRSVGQIALRNFVQPPSSENPYDSLFAAPDQDS